MKTNRQNTEGMIHIEKIFNDKEFFSKLTEEIKSYRGKCIIDDEIVELGMRLSTIDFEPEDRTPYFKRREAVIKSDELEHFKRQKLLDIDKLLLEIDNKEYKTVSFMLFKLFCDTAGIAYYNDKNLLNILNICYEANKEKGLTMDDLYEKFKAE